LTIARASEAALGVEQVGGERCAIQRPTKENTLMSQNLRRRYSFAYESIPSSRAKPQK
jgi:hypothetical protein